MNNTIGKVIGVAISLIIIAIIGYFFYGTIVSIIEDTSLITIVAGILGTAIAIAFIWGVFFRR